MSRKQRLELTWIGKDARPRLEPRILIEDPDRSYHAAHRVTENDIFDNRLIFGDNLLALKALEQEFTGKVKCVFIDPPYNTGSAFTHYDDGLEHSIWLSMMRDRLEIIRRLLSEDGSLWITIDDNECHYLKVMCDELFGRRSFITSIAWQKIYTTKNSAKHFSGMHDHILVYAKNIDDWRRNDLPRTAKQDDAYKNPDNDPRGPWKATPVHARNYYSRGLYKLVSPSGRIIDGPPQSTYWRMSIDKFNELNLDNKIWWGESGDNIPAQKRFLAEVQSGVVPSTWWTYSEGGHNGEAKNEVRALSADNTDLFITPKPEKLILRALQIASNPGDLVLDSFAGSGTTGAVAHKMGRRWIMVELGEHCHTHIIPRLKKVVDGEDPGGITKAVNWQGGGGFRYYRLAPSLLEKDRWDNWVIAKTYNAAMLAEAVCKLMGFTYAPSADPVRMDSHGPDVVRINSDLQTPDVGANSFAQPTVTSDASACACHWWQHGFSSERDFIYVTTQSLTHDQLRVISEEVGEERSLLICCKAFRSTNLDAFQNLTVKKIPQAVLRKCEWGKDDYSLNVANLPMVEQREELSRTAAEQLPIQPDLFSDEH